MHYPRVLNMIFESLGKMFPRDTRMVKSDFVTAVNNLTCTRIPG